MNIITVFDTEEELSRITGLNHDELWQAGFNLDDWDFGIMLDIPLTRNVKSVFHSNGGDYSYFHVSEDGTRQARDVHVQPQDYVYDQPVPLDDLPFWANTLVSHWADYCVGGSHTEHQGAHYYLWHHS